MLTVNRYFSLSLCFLIAGSILTGYLFFFSQTSARASGIVGDGTPESCTESSLRTALEGGGIVSFNCGPASHEITLTTQLIITSPTSLDGGNLIILNGSQRTRILNVISGATLNLANITLINGYGAGDYYGGAIWNSGTVTLENVTLKDNVAGVGGGIFNEGHLSLHQVNFEGNRAWLGGYTGGGAIRNDASGVLTVTASTFSANVADDSGGAIHNLGTMMIRESYFSDNQASSGHGGAITNYGTLHSYKNDFVGNHAGINGGAIDTIGTAFVNESIFNQNTARYRGGAINNFLGTLTVTQSSFLNNFGEAYGGGVANDAGNVLILASTFADNTTYGFGGGISNDGNLKLINSTVSGNDVIWPSGSGNDGFGGGLGARQGGSESSVIITNTTFVDNSAVMGGGNIDTSNTSASISAVIIAGGYPTNCAGDVISLGYNLESGNTCKLTNVGDLSNTDPLIGSLQNNGGETLTHALLEGSSAIDADGSATCPSIDQRGKPRPFGSSCDIGAVEYYPLRLAEFPGDQTLYLHWEIDGVWPITTTWSIQYTPTATQSITGLDFSTRAYNLTGLTNYTIYTVTLQAVVGETTMVSDTITQFPTDHLIYFPFVTGFPK